MLTLAVAPCPSPEDVPALTERLHADFPLSENSEYLDSLAASPLPRVVAERVGALSLLPSLVRLYGWNPADVRLLRDGRGRPYLQTPNGDRPLDFNLSHAGGHTACACVPAPHRVGVDVEEPIDPARADRLIHRFCTAGELAGLSENAIARAGDFTRLWTVREALSKYAGTGQPLRFDAAAPPAGVRLVTAHLPDTGAYLTVCCSGEVTTPIAVADGSLPMEILADFRVL